MNDLSAPRLILAITRLLRLSECFLKSVRPLRTAPSDNLNRCDSPNVNIAIIIPIQHDMIEFHPQLFLQSTPYLFKYRGKGVIHINSRARVFKRCIWCSGVCGYLAGLGECTTVHLQCWLVFLSDLYTYESGTYTLLVSGQSPVRTYKYQDSTLHHTTRQPLLDR
jgi:hypothetical protein